MTMPTKVLVPPWLIWCALFLGVIPLAFSFYVNQSLISGSISYDLHVSLLKYFDLVAWPGIGVSKLFRFSGHFWFTDMNPSGLVNPIFLFWVYNSVGWLLVLAIAKKLAALVALLFGRNGQNT